ncbi:MAG: EAL and GGDEF domain-containing protein [Pseudomonadota bacterium]
MARLLDEPVRSGDLAPTAWPGLVSRHVVEPTGAVRFLAMSDAAADLLGLAAAALCADPERLFGRVHEADRPLLRAWLAEPGAAEPRSGPSRLRVRYVRPDGERFLLEAIAGIDARGQGGSEREVFWFRFAQAQTEAICTCRDVEACGFGIYHFDTTSGTIIHGGRYWTMLGYPADDPERDGATWWSLIHPDDLPLVRRTFDVPAREQAPSVAIEYRVRHRAGHWVWVLDHLTGLDPDAEGRPRRFVGIHLDITERKVREVDLAANEQRFRALFENIHSIAVQGYDARRRVIYWNRASEELYGYSRDEAMGRRLEDLIIPPPMRSAVRGAIRAWIDEGVPIPAAELTLQRKDGTPVPVYASHTLQRNAAGEAELFCLDVDLGPLKQAERRLCLTAKAFESAAEAVVIGDARGRILYVNRAFVEMTGYGEAEVVGRRPLFLLGPGERLLGEPRITRTLRRRGSWAGDLRLVRRDGAIFPVWLTLATVERERGRLDGYVGVFGDITDLDRSKTKLDYLAHHDPLTGLANRLRLEQRLDATLERARHAPSGFALMFVALDRLKTINDGLGHTAGDALLIQAAMRLQHLIGPQDFLARFGGDEFVVLAEGCTRAELPAFAERLMAAFDEPFHVAGHDLYVTARLGASLYPDDARDAETLLKNADMAMCRAKAEGRRRIELFDPAMAEEVEHRLALENGLRQAVGRGELRLVYQPQVDLVTNELAGVEALVRWHSAELGEVPPAVFVPVAEDIGLVGEIGAWVLREACRQMVAWERDGLWVPSMAVNLAVRELERPELVELVIATLREMGLEPWRLEIEVTETMIMRAMPIVCRSLEALRQLGVTVAVDDFGTGYSSLAYLNGLPLNRLKIDRSFIQKLGEAPDAYVLPRAIIALGRSLRLEVVAEGVENAAQADFLRQEGCAIAQGFWFARPVPPDELARTLTQRGLWPEPVVLPLPGRVPADG